MFRSLILAAALIVTATAAMAGDWFAPAEPQKPAAAVTSAPLAQSIPPALNSTPATAVAAGSTPSSGTNAFDNPLMSPEDLGQIAPAAGPAEKDLTKGFEDPQPAQ